MTFCFLRILSAFDTILSNILFPTMDVASTLPSKPLYMQTLLLIKEIYLEGFKNIQNYVVKHYFKAFAWFTLAMYAIVLYAFLFRLSTGFVFSNL